ncbi:MAG: transposase [Gemmataceae bacterium]
MRRRVCSPGRVLSPTLAAQPGRPVRVEHEYQRKGALNLFAAFDTRTGKVYAHTAERKRQKEFIEFLEQLESEIPASVTKIHLVMDNLRMHTGKQERGWRSIPVSSSTTRRFTARG